MKFRVFQETRQGARHSNQDRIGYLYTKESLLMVVCDGMGGHYKGEVAAEFVVHYLAKAFRALAQPKLKDPAQFLYKSIHAAHESLLRYAAKEGMKETPRTTCVVAVIQDGKAFWAHVGDSRLYLVREGAVHARTMDHSHVQSLIDARKITEEQAAVHPERNKIYNCIGQPGAPRVDIQKSITLRNGDYLLLATDGLWGPIPIPFVSRALTGSGVDIGVPTLMDMSEAVSGRECDNLSAVGLQWLATEGAPLTDPIDLETRPIGDEDLAIAVHVVKAAIMGRSAML